MPLTTFVSGGGRCQRSAAGCEKVEGGGVKLNNGSAYGNVAYCSRECQKAHWPSHKLSCRGRSNGQKSATNSGKVSSVVSGIMSGTVSGTMSGKNSGKLSGMWGVKATKGVVGGVEGDRQEGGESAIYRWTRNSIF
ncbi:unnamed protein product [Closterium sp. NIES-53]